MGLPPQLVKHSTTFTVMYTNEHLHIYAQHLWVCTHTHTHTHPHARTHTQPQPFTYTPPHLPTHAHPLKHKLDMTLFSCNNQMYIRYDAYIQMHYSKLCPLGNQWHRSSTHLDAALRDIPHFLVIKTVETASVGALTVCYVCRVYKDSVRWRNSDTCHDGVHTMGDKVSHAFQLSTLCNGAY